MNSAAITFYGGVGSVTGSNFLFEYEGTGIIIDCGLIQGEAFCDECNYDPFAYDPASPRYLFATHAHADHIGRIPKLVKEGFSGSIYSTAATRDLAEVMFEDAVSILAQEAERLGREPLYSAEDVAATLSRWKTIDYGETERLSGGIEVTPRDAGHILGSAIYEFVQGGKKVVFTGDIGNSPAPLLKDTEEVIGASYLVMESVYGDRNHEGRETRVEMLKDAIQTVIDRKGVLVIPSFSIQRTQVLLYLINNFVEDGALPEIPVFLDSPLAIKVTDIYRRYTHLLKERVQEEIRGGDDIFDFPKFVNTKSVKESKAILDAPDPKIVIAGSGMSTGGRILHHEKHYLSNPNNLLLLVGYQAVGTLGRRIQGGAKYVTLGDERVPVRAEVRTIRGFSAHKDSEHLLEFVSHSADTLKKVFLAMGEPKASLFLAQRIRDFLGIEAKMPEKGERVELEL